MKIGNKDIVKVLSLLEGEKYTELDRKQGKFEPRYQVDIMSLDEDGRTREILDEKRFMDKDTAIDYAKTQMKSIKSDYYDVFADIYRISPILNYDTNKYEESFETIVQVSSNGYVEVLESANKESKKQLDENRGFNFGVEYRNMHDGIHRLIVTDTEDKAKDILSSVKELENLGKDGNMTAEEYELVAASLYDTINSLSNDVVEINYRDVQDGMWQDIKVINADDTPDLYESANATKVLSEDSSDKINVDFEVPGFYGYYNSSFTQFISSDNENINKIGKKYVEVFNEYVGEVEGIVDMEYDYTWSPKSYNYESDEIIATATIFRSALLKTVEGISNLAGKLSKLDALRNGYSSSRPTAEKDFKNIIKFGDAKELSPVITEILQMLTDQRTIHHINEDTFNWGTDNLSYDMNESAKSLNEDTLMNIIHPVQAVSIDAIDRIIKKYGYEITDVIDISEQDGKHEYNCMLEIFPDSEYYGKKNLDKDANILDKTLKNKLETNNIKVKHAHDSNGLNVYFYYSEYLDEDTEKQNGKWVNKGKEGTHGTFKTKKEADAQRKAMFANGYKAESLNEAMSNEVKKSFMDEYKKEYERLYKNPSLMNNSSAYDAMDKFDYMLLNDDRLIRELASYRGDAFTSDREVVAFMNTLNKFKSSKNTLTEGANGSTVVETYVFDFPGYYNTQFDMLLSADDKEYNKEIMDAVGKEIAASMLAYSDIGPEEGIMDIKYAGTYSPQSYNYSTDEINIDVTCDLEKIANIIEGGSLGDDFESFIKERNSSRDGYISFMPTSKEEFANIVRNNGDHVADAISEYLEFIITPARMDAIYDDTFETMVNNYGLPEDEEEDEDEADVEESVKKPIKEASFNTDAGKINIDMKKLPKHTKEDDKIGEIRNELERIANEVREGNDISWNETAYLQNHQDIIKKYYPNDIEFWQIAGIPEEEWNNRVIDDWTDDLAECFKK